MTEPRTAITLGGKRPGRHAGAVAGRGLGRPRDDLVGATTSSTPAGNDHDELIDE
jgi:hypothetical protein